MLRKIKISDIKVLSQLEKEHFNYNLSPNFFLKIINHQIPYMYYLNTRFKKITSYLSISIIDDEADMHSLATVKKYRHKGYMKKLLLYVFNELKKMGVAKIFLECRISNSKAIKLYEQLGFISQGIRKNYYPNEDGISYLKEIK